MVKVASLSYNWGLETPVPMSERRLPSMLPPATPKPSGWLRRCSPSWKRPSADRPVYRLSNAAGLYQIVKVLSAPFWGSMNHAPNCIIFPLACKVVARRRGAAGVARGSSATPPSSALHGTSIGEAKQRPLFHNQWQTTSQRRPLLPNHRQC